MALVEGESLAERLRRQGRFDKPRDAVMLVVKVAAALAAVHAAQIVHRDLKAGNILLDLAGQPFLTDFGLAYADDGEHLTATSQLLGTPAYMAPEQASPDLGPVGAWSDQYSLGVVLYELLTGRLPFEGSVRALIFQIGSKQAPPPSQHRPDLDHTLEATCLKALARLPAQRFGSMQEFATALSECLDRSSEPAGSFEGTALGERDSKRGRRKLEKPKRQQVAEDEARSLNAKARRYWSKRTEDGLRKSIVLFNRALDRDPSIAIAWAGLADAYHQLGHWGLAPPSTTYPRGKGAALKAIELDESLTEAHLALAVILKDYDWNFAEAERVFRQALQRQQDHASGRQWYGQCLACMGRHDEAIAELRRARELEPLAPIHDAVLGRHGYFFARQYDKARDHLLGATLTDPGFWIAQNFLGWVHLMQGNIAAGLASLTTARALDNNLETLVALGYGYGLAGQVDKAKECLAALTVGPVTRYVAPINIGLIYTGLGDTNQAFVWLNKACDDHSQWLSEIRVDPAFDPLRSDPRFDALLQRMKLKL
jgi:tetratricopeptide (TPR) repeat protein